MLLCDSTGFHCVPAIMSPSDSVMLFPAAPPVSASFGLTVTGDIIALRLVDVAYEMDLKEAERLWLQRQSDERARPARASLSTTSPKAVSFGNPPLTIDLGTRHLILGLSTHEVAVAVRLYDFGAVAIEIRRPVTDMLWQDFVTLHDGIFTVLDNEETATVWRDILSTLRQTLLPCWKKPTDGSLQEDYQIAFVRHFNEPISIEALDTKIDIAALLSGETRPLSQQARRDLLRQRFSYYEDDLVILTWDRAFIIDARGDSDILDVLEVANAQLLEMRFYDELLDAELPRMYNMVEAARKRFDIYAPRRFATLARRFHTLVAEVTELTERVDNALQVTEDVYLARIYGAALDLFRVKAVSAAVDRKLDIVRDTYSALYEEAAGSRGQMLEVAVILLIMIEVFLALLRVEH
ncbi:Hypothetical protein GbCGDNIH9_1127 [Granulibacter bethesdensis]|uniref:Uncharacterized protein n=1 Tax=Granulibacter bethesdensis TaxID=364410 RepID=A0AAC9P8D4_9PROT|nr:Hypothetical protein GbCGDNIH9_1127 [Granulibacter bethesdensis]APH61992.1 Hypothetical protein GbCGDNIH8_1127 [Granulibacter bethesdensis]